MLTVKEVVAKVSRLQTKYAVRDQRMRDVLSVRQGDISKVYPAMFSEEYPKPLVANFVAESGATLKTSLGLTIGTDILYGLEFGSRRYKQFPGRSPNKGRGNAGYLSTQR